MRKIIIPLIFSGLVLTGCAGQDEDIDATITPQAPPTTTSEEETSTPTSIALNEPVNIATLPQSEVLFTVTDAQLGGECRYGTNDYGGESDPGFGKIPEGKQALQLWAEVDVQALQDRDWMMLRDPEIVDPEGFVQHPEMDVDCRTSDEGHVIWSDTVNEGDKKRMYGSWVVPENIDKVRIHGLVFEVEALGEAPLPESTAPVPTTPVSTTATAPVQVESAPVIGMTEAPGAAQPSVMNKVIQSCGDDPMMYQPGTTFFTDGTTGWTEQCAGLS